MLSRYPEKRAVCHWHDDLEIILVLNGQMNYYMNGQILLLQKGDAILVNTRVMHYGYSEKNHDCEFICILFHPSLLTSNKSLFEHCILPFLSTSAITHVRLHAGQYPSEIDLIYKIYEKKKTQDAFYELEVIGSLYTFMAAVLQICKDSAMLEPYNTSDDIRMLRKMVSYIQENYTDTISLNSIAESAGICKSKCCSLFRSQIHMTPFDFLNQYRLRKSAALLQTTDIQITAIALSCGFNNPSYYSRLFFRLFHCTPSAYRRG